MHVRRVGDREHLVVLEKGDRLVDSLRRFAAEQGIRGGWASGVGSVRNAELGWFDRARRTYARRTFEEDLELTGAQGNLAMEGPEPVLHLHAALSGPEMISLAGHLFEAEVAASAEFLVRDFGVRLDRAEDPASRLRLLQPEKPARKEPNP